MYIISVSPQKSFQSFIQQISIKHILCHVFHLKLFKMWGAPWGTQQTRISSLMGWRRCAKALRQERKTNKKASVAGVGLSDKK